MLKLTRLDHRVVAINPDHIQWVEANPDTTLCLLGDRKIIVRESLDEVCDRYVAVRSRIGCTTPIAVQPQPQAGSRRPGSPSGRPMGPYGARSSQFPPAPVPMIVDDSPESNGSPYRNSYPPASRNGGE